MYYKFSYYVSGIVLDIVGRLLHQNEFTPFPSGGSASCSLGSGSVRMSAVWRMFVCICVRLAVYPFMRPSLGTIIHTYIYTRIEVDSCIGKSVCTYVCGICMSVSLWLFCSNFVGVCKLLILNLCA